MPIRVPSCMFICGRFWPYRRRVSLVTTKDNLIIHLQCKTASICLFINQKLPGRGSSKNLFSNFCGGLDALSAGLNALSSTDWCKPLQIWQPTASCFAVGVTDVVSRYWLLATNITFNTHIGLRNFLYNEVNVIIFETNGQGERCYF